MFRAKLFITLVIAIFGVSACFRSEPERYLIAEDKGYESSLFRQNCAVCHGIEGDGKTLEDGTVVPSLRDGEFKKKTETEIHDQISEGGNGMTPFRTQLTEREILLLTELVHNKLRQ